jgi:hypothetical protein
MTETQNTPNGASNMTDTNYFPAAVTIELDRFSRVRGKPGQVKTVTRTTTGVGHYDEARKRWVFWYAGARGAVYESNHSDPRSVWVCRSFSPSARPMYLDRAAIRFSNVRPATETDLKVVFPNG